jgi:hypothetical protein
VVGSEGNTGGGKIIAGLLILQASIHEGVAPALYLAPAPTLLSRCCVPLAASAVSTKSRALPKDHTTLDLFEDLGDRLGPFGRTSPPH